MNVCLLCQRDKYKKSARSLLDPLFFTISVLLLSLEGGEESSSDGGDSLLVDKGKSVIKGLRANDSVLTGQHDEATHAGLLSRLIELRQEVLLVDLDLARNVSTHASFDLSGHHLFVLLDSGVNNFLHDSKIRLSDTQSDIDFNKLDKTLHKQVLEKLLILVRVFVEVLDHSSLSIVLQLLNKLVNNLHLLNAEFVLLSTLLDLELGLSVGKFGFVVLSESLLVSLNLLLLTNGEFIFGLLANLLNTLLTVGLDERDHRVENLLCLLIIHLYIKFVLLYFTRRYKSSRSKNTFN